MMGRQLVPLQINHTLSPRGSPRVGVVLQGTLGFQRTQFENHFASESRAAGRCSIIVFKMSKLKDTCDEKGLSKYFPQFPNPVTHFQAPHVLFGFVFIRLEELVDLPNLNRLESCLQLPSIFQAAK